MVDVADVYADTYGRFTTLATDLSEAELSLPVVACPGWSAKDTIGHVTGIAVDLVSGKGRVADPASTARQVEERREGSVSDLLSEWAGVFEPLLGLLRSAGSGLTAVAIDIWTHEQDVRNSVGRPGGREAPGRELTLKAAIAADQRVTAAGLPPMHLVTGEKTWFLGRGARHGAGVVLNLDPYEAARMLLGRRTYEEIAAYPWVGDGRPYLPLLHQFTVPDRSLGE